MQNSKFLIINVGVIVSFFVSSILIRTMEIEKLNLFNIKRITSRKNSQSSGFITT